MRRLACLIALVSAVVLRADNDARLTDLVKAGNRDAVRALLNAPSASTLVNAPDADQTTPLHWAVRADDLELVQMLLRAGADAKAANRYAVTPLSLAATN